MLVVVVVNGKSGSGITSSHAALFSMHTLHAVHAVIFQFEAVEQNIIYLVY